MVIISAFVSALQWLSTVVMGWLTHIYSGNAASAQSSIKNFHQKISHFLYETYTRTRIEQLFNIIIGEFI
jgi:anaphase-promoting complex subunit 2